jgi:hypothetical protein
MVPGIVDVGLFVNMASEAYFGWFCCNGVAVALLLTTKKLLNYIKYRLQERRGDPQDSASGGRDGMTGSRVAISSRREYQRAAVEAYVGRLQIDQALVAIPPKNLETKIKPLQPRLAVAQQRTCGRSPVCCGSRPSEVTV